jgi:hypothetical protein
MEMKIKKAKEEKLFDTIDTKCFALYNFIAVLFNIIYK